MEPRNQMSRVSIRTRKEEIRESTNVLLRWCTDCSVDCSRRVDCEEDFVLRQLESADARISRRMITSSGRGSMLLLGDIAGLFVIRFVLCDKGMMKRGEKKRQGVYVLLLRNRLKIEIVEFCVGNI